MAFIPLNLGNFNISKEPLSTSLTKINDMIEELYTFSEEGDLGSISQNIVPDQDNLRDLGSADKKWRSLYVSGNTIYLGNSEISVDNQGNLSVNGASIAATTWENVLGRPEIPTSIFNLDVPQSIIRPGFLKYDGSNLNWVELSVVAESGDYDDLSNKPVLFSGSYIDLTNKPIIPADISDLTDTQNLLTSGSYNDLTDKPTIPADISDLTDTGDLLEQQPSRITASATTGPLFLNQTGNISITGFKSYAILKITTEIPAWVRIYSDQASRTADASRTENQDPAPGAGIIAEIITTGPSEQTILMTPTVIGFNNESPVTNIIPVAVTNKGTGLATIEVTLTILKLED
jgi:hypothetical protein